MYNPPVIFDPVFVQNVIVGFLITLLGAVVLLAAAVWWVRAGEWLNVEPKPFAWRALSTAGVLLFLVGWLWQIIGYLRVGAVTF